jgi:hypothetical protein
MGWVLESIKPSWYNKASCKEGKGSQRIVAFQKENKKASHTKHWYFQAILHLFGHPDKSNM